ncbi:NAD-dependent epimerase/dehydratase family protein [Pseudomonas kurunegalensis]|uniref:NAD-dependent epimerase/dehydratase family protein n=1 Tax=Pseudomonas kurunegalensis TaxID=485880 RepID=UPI0025704307|nr:NAD(P)-dependent oxidoreductase [Pseudomonas kurunegalensis]WJD65160.1 NAD(P)-dependent oxidoreductase [Pseudomonas kurunegalensis]
MTIHFNRILLTGAAGGLGTQLRPFLRERCNALRITDREPIMDPVGNEESVTLDLADFESVLQAVENVDAIVHLGGVSRESTFENIMSANIQGMYNVYEAARRLKVKRIIWGSSVHAVGYHKRTDVLQTDCVVRPDSLYGVSKVFGEGLAQYYFDKFGLESVSIRIGSSFPKPVDWRMLSTWLSYADLKHLIERCLLVPKVDHTIIFGCSRNDQSFWDNGKAAYLGYRPQDNAESFRPTLEVTVPKPAHDDTAISYQGGSFVVAGHFEDK